MHGAGPFHKYFLEPISKPAAPLHGFVAAPQNPHVFPDTLRFWGPAAPRPEAARHGFEIGSIHFLIPFLEICYNPPMSKAVQEIFSSIAPRYDFLNHFMSLSIDRRWREIALAALNGKHYDRILDLCAGTLDLSSRLAEIFPRSQIVAADFSMAMLEEGRKKLTSNPAACVCADGHFLPFRGKSFDAVICAFGIRNLENRERAMGEIQRILTREGKLVVLDFFRPTALFSKFFHHTYGKWVIPSLGGIFSKNRRAYRYLQDSIQNFFSAEEYCVFLKNHGFRTAHALPLSGGIAHRIVAEL